MYLCVVKKALSLATQKKEEASYIIYREREREREKSPTSMREEAAAATKEEEEEEEGGGGGGWSLLRNAFSVRFVARMEEGRPTTTTTTTRKERDEEAEDISGGQKKGREKVERESGLGETLASAADYVLKKPKEEREEEKRKREKKKKKKEKPKVYEPIRIPTAEEQMQGDVMNNCVVKTMLSGVMGGFLGVAMGIFFGAFEAPDHTMTQKKVSITETLKTTARSTASKSWSYAKGFAAFGALYAGSECVVEQTRARHDIYNSAYAGCFTGGTMAARAGPKAACIGCGTMAALSVAMDHFMGLH